VTIHGEIEEELVTRWSNSIRVRNGVHRPVEEDDPGGPELVREEELGRMT
jgi:hypothetical protein